MLRTVALAAEAEYVVRESRSAVPVNTRGILTLGPSVGEEWEVRAVAGYLRAGGGIIAEAESALGTGVGDRQGVGVALSAPVDLIRVGISAGISYTGSPVIVPWPCVLFYETLVTLPAASTMFLAAHGLGRRRARYSVA